MDDCFRYWEIGSLGVRENILQILPSSKAPKLPAAKANKKGYRKVIGEKMRKRVVVFAAAIVIAAKFGMAAMLPAHFLNAAAEFKEMGVNP